MIVTATIAGAPIEIYGTPEECARVIRQLYSSPAIEYGKSKIVDQMIGRGTREFQRSAVEEIVNAMASKKVCDPMARHYGNCGAKDCQIIAAQEYKTQVSDNGEIWIDESQLRFSRLEDYRYSRRVPK